MKTDLRRAVPMVPIVPAVPTVPSVPTVPTASMRADFRPPSRRLFCALLILLALAPRSSWADEAVEFFEKRIRPVLAEHCYSCHSAESEKVRGGLLLDTRDGLRKGGESGPAIVPGDPEGSLLIKAVRRTDEKLQMPPKKALSAAQTADLAEWVRLGAPDPRSGTPLQFPTPALNAARSHWAFQAPVRPPIPAVRDTRWPRHEVDHFVLARIESAGLRPSPEAEKRALIRRVSYDLTGLPPTPEEVRAFLADSSEEAYSRVVSRLLDSPRHGERWARHWLDVARFADTKGYVYTDREESQFVHSHVYRDWVIEALNRDLPYDEFIRQQIAGDQLPARPGAPSPLAATGFLTVGRRFLGVTHDIIDDRIDVVSKATQALTVSCARCHDHKFDPIPIEDYYSLYGVFDSSTERTVRLENQPRETSAYAAFKKGYDERHEKLQNAFAKRIEELLAKLRLKTPEYLAAVLEADQLPTEEHYELRGPDDLNPTIARRWQSYLLEAGKSFHPVWAPWHLFAGLPKSTFAERAPGAWADWLRAHGPRLNSLVREKFEAAPPASMEEVARTYGALLAAVNTRHLEQAELNTEEKALEEVLYGAASPISVPAGSVWDIEWFFHEAVRVEFGRLQSEIDRWIVRAAGAPRFAVILEDKAELKNPRVFRRGNPANRGEEVPRQYLGLVAGTNRQPFQRGSGRLELAQAIASRENPLTARVIVNRVWAHHFGEGLVRTVNDFGLRSEPPSHPELLDWLAVDFMENGWSLKRLHRQILLSSTYRQTASELAENAPARSQDPENRLLARAARHRLGFEELRDSLLTASGELSAHAGGKPLPLFARKFVPHRTIYGLVDRQFLPGVYRIFDFPNPDLPSGQRLFTTVPQQALYLLNNRFLADRARSLARRAEFEGSQAPAERVQFLYQTAFQRAAETQEVQQALDYIGAAAKLPAPAPPPPPPKSDWSYGFGSVRQGKVEVFQPLPAFAEESWRGSEEYPDEKLGWVKLTSEGGHAGNDLDHAAIRRWTSPVEGRINLTATLEHKPSAGDGIHAAIVSSRHGVIGEWNLHNVKTKMEFERLAVSKGDVIDFVVDIRGGLNSDEFLWAPVLKFTGENSAGYEKTEWDAKKDFSGPPDPASIPLTPWESLAQALLLANEFTFVD